MCQCISELNVDIKYFNKNAIIQKIENGDWIDLRCVGIKEICVSNNIGNEKTPILERQSFKQSLEIEKGIFEAEKVEFIRYRKGNFLLLDLGIAMKLPKGYEANVVPRGSTYKNFTFTQTNSFGIIDESYCGNNDKWFMPVVAHQDGFIIIGERIAQFRVQKKMPKLNFNIVENLDTNNRKGFGSTGTL